MNERMILLFVFSSRPLNGESLIPWIDSRRKYEEKLLLLAVTFDNYKMLKI